MIPFFPGKLREIPADTPAVFSGNFYASLENSRYPDAISFRIRPTI
jgi:hypothetical protein